MGIRRSLHGSSRSKWKSSLQKLRQRRHPRTAAHNLSQPALRLYRLQSILESGQVAQSLLTVRSCASFQQTQTLTQNLTRQKKAIPSSSQNSHPLIPHPGQARKEKSITPCNSSREAPPADCTDIPCITAITYRAKSPASVLAGKSPSALARANRSRSAASPVARRAINSFRIGSASSPQAKAPCTIKHPFGFPGHESKSAVPTINRSATARAVGNFSASAVKFVIRSE